LVFISIWAVVALAQNLIEWRSGIKREQLGTEMEADYVVNSFGRILEKPISFHKKHKIGNISHRIMRSGTWLNRIASYIIIETLPQFFSIIVALVICAFFNIVLTSFFLLGIAVYAFILLKILPSVAGLQIKMLSAYQKAYGGAMDVVINTRSVKQAVAENYEKNNLYKEFRLRATGFLGQLIIIWRNLTFAQRVIILAAEIAVFLYSAFLIRDGLMTIGELVMFMGYAVMIFNPFIILANNWQAIQNGLMSFVQSENILSAPAEKYVPENAVILKDIQGAICFKDVGFSYKKGNKILTDIDFEIKPGETIALVGESGVGKSTLVDLICGFYFPSSGKILLDGHDIKKIDLKFLRSRIGIVPQELILFNDTVKNNIHYAKISASDSEIKEAALMACASEFIENFPRRYNQLVGERGVKLSAGQKQRVAIARVFLQNPRILILDEPTSALDAKSEKMIQESLAKLMKNKTTLIIAHRLSTVRKADKILVLDKGRIAEQGRHEELIKIKDGIYRKLYELQFGFD